MNHPNKSEFNDILERVKSLLQLVAPGWEKKFEQQIYQFKVDLQDIIDRHQPSSTNIRMANNADPQTKYKPLSNSLLNRRSTNSDIYLWQRKSDGILFKTEKFHKTMSIDKRDAILREVTYLIENIMIQPHPCILHFVESFIDREERLCVVMEQFNDEKLTWLIQQRQNEWFSENDMMNWIAQICLAERHIDVMEQQLQIGIIFDIDDIFFIWGSNGSRNVKVRIHPLPSYKNISRSKSMRQANIMSIFYELLPETFKDSDQLSDTFKQFARDFHNQEFSTLTQLIESNFVEKSIEAATSSVIGKITPHNRLIHIATIGQGSFGRVEKMWDRKKNKVVAVKKIQVVMSPNETAEIEVMRQCKHWYIVKLVDYFTVKGHLRIVMEYCDGGNLHDRIQAQGGGAFSWKQVISFFGQVLFALNYLHKKTKYFHGDIKPKNILLTSNSTVKLGDFGASQVLCQNQSVMSTIRKFGTPEYMAPEIVQSKPSGKRSDLWSLGCLLYEMVALSPAFRCNDKTQMVDRITRADYLPIPFYIPTLLTEKCIPLIHGLLQVDPVQRMTLKQVSKCVLSQRNFHTRDKENRNDWYDGHAPLHEIHSGTYPMLPWTCSSSSPVNHINKLSLLNESAIIWMRIRRENDDWIVDCCDCTRDYRDRYLFKNISMTIFFNPHNNGEEIREKVGYNEVLIQREWNEVLRFHNISGTIAFIQVSIQSGVRGGNDTSESMLSDILEAISDGVYPIIDCHSRLQSRQDWKKMCKNEHDELYLANLRVSCVEQSFTVSLWFDRVKNNLWMYLESDCQCPRFIVLQLHYELILTNMDGEENVIKKTQLVEFAQLTQESFNTFVYCENLFESAYHLLVPPRVNIRVNLPEEEVKFWWRCIPPITLTSGENGFCHVLVLDSLLPSFDRWIRGNIDCLWLPAILLTGESESVAIVIGLKMNESNESMVVTFHPQMPLESTPSQMTIDFELTVIHHNKNMTLIQTEQTLVIGHEINECICQKIKLDDIRYDTVLTSPQARIRINYNAET